MSFSYQQMMMGAAGDDPTGEQNQQQQQPQYTMPKILDYLQSEWFKYEIDRAHWVSEKSDLMQKISKLESEKKTQEVLRNDLFRRIKMLEYALQQERSKNQPNILSNTENDPSTTSSTPTTTTTTTTQQPRSHGKKSSKVSITRNLIKKYLKEMNYNDILVSKPDLHGLGAASDVNDDVQDDKQTTILNLPELKKQANQQKQQKQQLKSSGGSNGSNGNNSGNNSISKGSSQFRQLQQQLSNVISTSSDSVGGDSPPNQLTSSDPLLSSSIGDGYSLSDLTNSLDSLSSALDSLSDGGSAGTFDFSSIDNLDSLKMENNEQKSATSSSGDMMKSVIDLSGSGDSIPSTSNPGFNTVVSSHAPVLISDDPAYDDSTFNEEFFNKLSSNSKGRMKLNLGGKTAGKSAPVKSTTPVGSIGKKKGLAAELMGLGAGDLNDIKLEDNTKISSDSATPRVWRYKHSLKSHFDGVRSLQFHPSEPLLVSASEDSTLKLWNLNQLAPGASKKASTDVEPIYTFRGHNGPVFATALSADASKLYSAGCDSVIKCWNIPPADIDPYHSHGNLQSLVDCEFAGHTDGVWDLLAVGSDRLISASADATVRVWNDDGSQVGQFAHPSDPACIPTTLSLIPTDANRLLVGYVDGTVLLYDLQTGQTIATLASTNPTSKNNQVNKVVAHPMLPVAITGTEDNKIEFWDLQSCQPIHSMVAHSDAVTSLTIDPSGLYVASSSHDSTIRFWDISSKTCVQDLQSHRPKFDESIHAIKYHPTKGYFASGGADSVVRIHQ